MAKEQLAVIEMITNMILGKTNGVSKVDFTPQKIPFPENLPYEQAFLRATPESQGVSSEKLIHLLSNLSASPYTDMHHFLVLRHGNVICDLALRLTGAAYGTFPIPCVRVLPVWQSDC